MNNPTNDLKPMGVQDAETVAMAKAQEALVSARKATGGAMDKAADKVDDAKAGAGMALDKAAGIANAVADKAKDQLDAVKGQVRDQIADYASAEPLKAMLIAAATGAVLMALLSMMVSSRD